MKVCRLSSKQDNLNLKMNNIYPPDKTYRIQSTRPVIKNKNNRSGRNGKDNIIEVPLGNIAKDEERGAKEVEILEGGQEVVWIKGGRGGLGNTNFKTPTNQAPDYAQPGEEGIEGWKIIEL